MAFKVIHQACFLFVLFFFTENHRLYRMVCASDASRHTQTHCMRAHERTPGETMGLSDSHRHRRCTFSYGIESLQTGRGKHISPLCCSVNSAAGQTLSLHRSLSSGSNFSWCRVGLMKSVASQMKYRSSSPLKSLICSRSDLKNKNFNLLHVLLFTILSKSKKLSICKTRVGL